MNDLNVRVYDSLQEEEKKIREDVFVKEQGFHDEFDERDQHCLHMILYKDHIPAGVCRFFEDEKEAHTWIIGRVCVVKEYRKDHLGSVLLKYAEEEIRKRGGKKIRLGAQERASAFYIKNGYHLTDERYMDEYCPHVMMEKNI